MMEESTGKLLIEIIDNIQECIRSQVSINEGIMLRLLSLEKGAE